MLPALALVAGLLLAPLLDVLSMAVRDGELRAALPASAAALRAWDGAGLPPEPVFATLAHELARSEQRQELGGLARRLNFERTGLRSLLLRTARAALAPPYRDTMPRLDARWADPASWRILRRAAGAATALYLLRAVDLDLSPEGAVLRQDPLFLPILGRSMVIALQASALCILLAYPVAYSLTVLPPGWARLATALVLVPFWISILVRTTAWFILLQREGVLNAALLSLGIVSQPLGLIFTRVAVLLAMVHVLLPFAILPLAGAMRRIDPGLLRAAASLGASGPQRFLRVYLPLTLPGVGAGALITFMLATGFYITPALVGGGGDQMIGAFIADAVGGSLNPGMAAALALLLLLATAAVALLGRVLLRRVA